MCPDRIAREPRERPLPDRPWLSIVLATKEWAPDFHPGPRAATPRCRSTRLRRHRIGTESGVRVLLGTLVCLETLAPPATGHVDPRDAPRDTVPTVLAQESIRVI